MFLILVSKGLSAKMLFQKVCWPQELYGLFSDYNHDQFDFDQYNGDALM